VYRVAGGWTCASAHNTDAVPNMETIVIGEDGAFRAANNRTGQVSLMSVAAPSAPRLCLRSHPHGDLRWHQHGALGDVSRLLICIDVHRLREWEFCRSANQ
jgi:hypothetical protein